MVLVHKKHPIFIGKWNFTLHADLLQAFYVFECSVRQQFTKSKHYRFHCYSIYKKN